ncbi:MAG: WD40 repeat domain-containing protein [Spirochaetaceae bacterium]|nr:WD40 repeat domain-containing protein [Spirochaetaceae bacterium]
MYAAKIKIGLILFGLVGGSCLSAQYQTGFALPGGHRGAVNVLIDDDRGRLLSAGADGFLEIWDARRGVALERFQVSLQSIQGMTAHPRLSQIGVLGSDEIGIYHVSIWDYETKERRFTLTFRDTISYITYSAGGTYLIAVRSGRASAVFIHAETGEILQTLDTAGPASFAATGKSERTMITYLPSGTLSYWDLNTGQEIRRFAAPPRISSPILFGNNRFLGGIDANGLVILDATSGAALIRDRIITQGFLLPVRPESSEFIGLEVGAYGSMFYHFVLTGAGKLGLKTSWMVSGEIPAITSAALAGDALVLGTADGTLWLGMKDGSARRLQTETKTQRFVAEAAVSGDNLVFLTRNRALGFVPLDYWNLEYIRLEPASYTQITAGREGLILWQDEHIRSVPTLRVPSGEDIPINLGLRFPLRSVAMQDDQALFLDALGNIRVISLKTHTSVFSFSSMAALDAVFLNRDNILISRGAVSGNTPFLMVNISTGETVPLAYPASAGARVYVGPSGIPYGVAIEQGEGVVKTAVLRLNLTNPVLTAKLFECEGEDTAFGLAESGGRLTATLGGYGAFFYDEAGAPKPLERGPGFPLRLINAGRYLITLDAEGSIAWHDPGTGKLLALLRLYDDDTWLLQAVYDRQWMVFTGNTGY